MSSSQEAGALLFRQLPNSANNCNILLLGRSDVGEPAKANMGIYFRALITWSDGRCLYEPHLLLDLFSSRYTVIVDPRASESVQGSRGRVDPRTQE